MNSYGFVHEYKSNKLLAGAKIEWLEMLCYDVEV